MPLSLLCSRTIGETIKDTRQEPLGLLTDKLRRVISCTHSASLQLGVRDSKDVVPGGITQRHVYVPEPGSISRENANWNKIYTRYSQATVHNSQREFCGTRKTIHTLPHGLAMKLGMMPCFIPMLFTANLNS